MSHRTGQVVNGPTAVLMRLPPWRHTSPLIEYLMKWTEPSHIIMFSPLGWALPKRKVSELPLFKGGPASENRNGGRWSCAGSRNVVRQTSLLCPVNMFSLSPPSEHDGQAGGVYLSTRRNFSPIMYWLLVPFVATSAKRSSLRRKITPLGPYRPSARVKSVRLCSPGNQS